MVKVIILTMVKCMYVTQHGERKFQCGAFLRPVPTGPIPRRLTPIVGQFPSADSRGLKILNMFDRARRLTITESVVELADSAVELADSTAVSSEDPVKIGLWVRAFMLYG